MSVRKASHAGSWYDAAEKILQPKLEQWLSAASVSHAPARAVIAPHAGYSYCGECAAYAYKQVDPAGIKRVFILGPSHHYYLRQCALSVNATYHTPLYDLTIDQKVYDELKSSGRFEDMSRNADEDEHSIEMHLPYVAQVMRSKKGNFTIVPILVGSLDEATERSYGALLAPYLGDPENLFVISSDFCHWGSRFSYTPYDKSQGQIHEYIEYLDRMGMSIIETLDPPEFAKYQVKYRNTICGRHPIGVLLNAVAALQQASPDLKPVLKFTRYAQSSKVVSAHDSSVSYASAALIIPS